MLGSRLSGGKVEGGPVVSITSGSDLGFEGVVAICGYANWAASTRHSTNLARLPLNVKYHSWLHNSGDFVPGSRLALPQIGGGTSV